MVHNPLRKEIDMFTNLTALESYAKENNVPIMQKDSIEYIKKIMQVTNVKNILEIGTAIGYSAICLASFDEKVHVTTVEIDKDRFIEAIDNVKAFGLEDRIDLVFNDAMNLTLVDKYDLILIDAAKAKNEAFFQKFKFNLKPNGIIITDNIGFHGLVGKSEEITSKNLRGLVSKIENYIKFLEENEEFETSFVDVGDGLAVSKRRVENDK